MISRDSDFIINSPPLITLRYILSIWEIIIHMVKLIINIKCNLIMQLHKLNRKVKNL